MADRDRYDWDRERGRDWDRDRGHGRGYERERGYPDERGMVSRGADDVRSWFGDDEAQRRREMDESRERQDRGWDFSDRDRNRGWGANSDNARREHGWGGSREGGGRWEHQHSDPRMHDSTRDWYDRGPNAGGIWSSNHTYGFGAPNWSGAPANPGANRGFDSERQHPPSFGGPNYAGGYSGATSNQTNPAMAGGYGAGSFAGRGPRNYQRSDDRVREDVNERLTADPRVDASDIDVRVQSGEVILSGTVDDRRTRRLAEEIIEDLPGVRDVRNELRVDRGRGFGGGNDRTEPPSDHRAGMNTTGRTDNRNDGAIGHTGDPQKREDVTTLNQTGKINR